MSFECLLSEFLVSSILNCIDLKSVGVAVDIVILSEEIRDWIDSHGDSESGVNHNLLVWYLSS